jgi:hypothetical protein
MINHPTNNEVIAIVALTVLGITFMAIGAIATLSWIVA